MLLPTLLFYLIQATAAFACSHAVDRTCCYTEENMKNTTRCLDWNLPSSTLDNAVVWPKDTLGRMNVSLPLSTNCTCYNIQLRIIENVAEKECNSQLNQPSKLHSERHIAFNMDNDCGNSVDKCKEVEMLTFAYVFPGCYKFEVTRNDGRGTQKPHVSNARYLHTDYSKTFIKKPQVSNLQRHSSGGSTLSVTVDPTITHSHTGLLVKTATCREIIADFVTCNNTECLCVSSCQNSCKIEANKIILAFKELDVGDYCLNIRMYDDRCNSGAPVWAGNECSFVHNFTITAQPEVNTSVAHPDRATKRFYLVLGIVSALALAAIFLVLYFLRYYFTRLRSQTRLPTMTNSVISMEPSRIFLLYARDCQPFMTLMETFREVLEDTVKCEVIDCLDASRWNEIGRSPVEWVHGHIEKPSTKVVLVATHCAYLRQQASLRQVQTHYKEPQSFDNLFVLGLKALTEQMSSDVYRKVCVVRFEGFSDDNNLFDHLNPYTRFVLPSHLQKLLANLRLSDSPEQNDQLKESKEKLSQDLTELIKYKNKNMDYIYDMLSIQRNEISC